MRVLFIAPLALACWLLLAAGEATLALAGDNSKQINVQLANEVIPLTSRAATVAGFLSELSITLPQNAASDPGPEAALQDGMTLSLPGLHVSRGAVEREIPVEVEFTQSYRYGSEGCLVADPGEPGLARTTMTIFYSDGVEVGRRQRTETLRPMRPKKLICYKALSAGEDGPSVEEILAARAAPGKHHAAPTRYKKALTMNSSAYEPGPRSCGRHANGITSCGLKAGYGVVAIDPKFIPYGTRLYIEGYGYAVAGDTGGAIDGHDIDLGFLTVDECMQWGRRKVKVYILY